MAVVKLHHASNFAKLCPLALLGTVFAIALTGCKSNPWAPNDAALTSKIQTTLAADPAVAGEPVQVAVQGGVATLTGSVANDAQRALAARDAAGVAGVKQVVNSIALGPSVAAEEPMPMPPSPAPTPVAPANGKQLPATRPTPPLHPRQPAPIERPQEASNPPPPQPQPQPQPESQPQLAPAPAPPPQPPFRNVKLAPGLTIPVRVTQTLDSATTQPDTTFSGVVASDIVIDGVVAIPAGSNVTGHVDAVQDAAHFKGSSLLTVSLVSINRHGEHFVITTDPYTLKGKGRGANTAEKTGAGAAVGAILGGIFGGGKGAAIGAAAGGGVGAGSQAVTRGQQVQIESESVVRFHLSTPITVKVRTDGGDKHGDEQGLQQRSNQ
jgi:hypothetical protein